MKAKGMVTLLPVLTFWQLSMNSSIVTTPSLFLSIFCSERTKKHYLDLPRDTLTPELNELKLIKKKTEKKPAAGLLGGTAAGHGLVIS